MSARGGRLDSESSRVMDVGDRLRRRLRLSEGTVKEENVFVRRRLDYLRKLLQELRHEQILVTIKMAQATLVLDELSEEIYGPQKDKNPIPPTTEFCDFDKGPTHVCIFEWIRGDTGSILFHVH